MILPRQLHVQPVGWPPISFLMTVVGSGSRVSEDRSAQGQLHGVWRRFSTCEIKHTSFSRLPARNSAKGSSSLQDADPRALISLARFVLCWHLEAPRPVSLQDTTGLMPSNSPYLSPKYPSIADRQLPPRREDRVTPEAWYLLEILVFTIGLCYALLLGLYVLALRMESTVQTTLGLRVQAYRLPPHSSPEKGCDAALRTRAWSSPFA